MIIVLKKEFDMLRLAYYQLNACFKFLMHCL